MDILGIDIGGSGIKGAPVDLKRGILSADRLLITTPQPANPVAVANCIADMARHFNWDGPIGCGLPAVVKSGIAYTAANIDPAWIGSNAQSLFSQATGCPTMVINDADAAGIAEMHYGAGKGKNGTVIMITVGTGLGTAIFQDGKLQPNTELGHLLLSNGQIAEKYASAAARSNEALSIKDWARRFDQYLHLLHDLFWPDLFIIGGGLSEQHEIFLPDLTVKAAILPAKMRNDAGIVGAALAAARISL